MTLVRAVSLLACLVCIAGAQHTHENLNAVLWVQTAAEYAAVARQTYRAATSALDRALKDPHWTAATEQRPPFSNLPPAVVLDLDETVVDNAPVQAQAIKRNSGFTNEAWMKWVGEARPGLVPGALQFLLHAQSRGIALFYVTNRQCNAGDASDPTARAVRKLNIPLESGRLLCRTGTGDKSPRRAHVASTHRVLLVVGDDLNDFLNVTTEKTSVPERAALIEAYGEFWGEKWFMLPNPMYGSWERAVGLDPKKKLESLKE